jgi:transcriptional regulator with PAS, ATPase and Fis domain
MEPQGSEKNSNKILLVGSSDSIRQMQTFAQKAAHCDDNILILGETGTGKDHLAEVIHSLSRAHHEFVTVDCGSLTPTLSEAELFGHTGGAFTGAEGEKTGLVEVAAYGTMFFNEVANMGYELQAKFLRILEKRPFRKVGGTKESEVKTRIIAATNADLALAVRQGEMRSDLYHRLNSITFTVPPLRERSEDIPLLADHFLWQKKIRKSFSPQAMAVMMNYHWPGNIRELKNSISRAVFFAGENKEILAEHVEPYLCGVGGLDIPCFAQVEKKYLRDALKRAKGKLSLAAKIADIPEVALKKKIREYDLTEFVDSLSG